MDAKRTPESVHFAHILIDLFFINYKLRFSGFLFYLKGSVIDI